MNKKHCSPLIKVAHVTTVDISLRYMLLNQLRHISKNGYKVTGISAPGPNIPIVKATGVRHIPVPMTRNFTPLADLISLWRLYRIMRRERFHIVHTHTPKAGLLGQLAARLARVPVVVNTLHGFYFHENTPPLWRRFYIATEKLAALCSNIILSQNKEDIQTAINERICPAEKIKHLGNGIDVQRFNRDAIDPAALAQRRSEFGLSPDTPVVGFVGRLVKEKGIVELLQAARLILEKFPTAKFLIIGAVDADKKDAVTPQSAHEAGVAEACIFAGEREDMPEMYALMDVFVLPSHREGFPRSAMEAASTSVPCVVTNIRGCREVVEHEHNGLMVPLHDVPALADAVTRVLSDAAEAQSMGAAGRRMALERFDEQRVFEQVINEYAHLLSKKNVSAPPS